MDEQLKSQIKKISDLDLSVQIGIMQPEIHFISVTCGYDFCYRHSHNCFEIHYLLSGNEIVQLDDQVYYINAGDAYFFGRDTTHCIFHKFNNLKLVINFDIKPTSNKSSHNMKYSEAEMKQLINTLYDTNYWIGRQSVVFTKVIEQIAEELLHKRLGYFTIIQNLLSNLMLLTIQAMAGGQSYNYRVPLKTYACPIIPIIQYIFDNYNQELTLEVLAKQFSFSTRHLNRIIKLHTGSTLQQVLTNIRLERAKRMIRNSTMPIEQVSECVGFSSYVHLSKVFEKMEGKTISEYRNYSHMQI